jgi:hypothetical protein
MQKFLFLLSTCAPALPLLAQTDTLPYYEIAAYPDDYTSGNVIARMIDALGFRYRHATEGLRPEDLAYRPSEDARSCYETLEHVYGLSEMILNAPQGDTMIRPEDWSALTYPDLRRLTLDRLAKASDLYRGMTADDLRQQRVMFAYNGNYSEYPLWNMLNGPLADAIYHTGQIVTFRRTTGNPSDGRVNVFRGRVME